MPFRSTRTLLRPRPFPFIAAALLPVGLLPAPARAADATHAWVVPAPRLAKEAYFSNLKDGATLETPFLLKFGLTGMGLAPIVKPVAKTGHHPLLVNRDLPMDFAQPLPFDSQYVHFGKGQMQTVLTFPPGRYTLRLVLADDKHIPNFVYSKPIAVTVSKKNTAVDPQSLVPRAVEILLPQAGATVGVPLRMAFHVSGYNVSNTTLTEKGSCHFRLRIKADTGRVEFIDNGAADQVLLKSEATSFSVTR